MQVVIAFLTSLGVAALARVRRSRQFLRPIDLAVSTLSTAVAVGLGSLIEASGTEWSPGMAVFLAVAITLGFSAFAPERPAQS